MKGKYNVIRIFLVFLIFINLLSSLININIENKEVEEKLYRVSQVMELFIPQNLQDDIIEGREYDQDKVKKAYEELSKYNTIEGLNFVYVMAYIDGRATYIFGGLPMDLLHMAGYEPFFLDVASEATDDIANLKVDILIGNKDRYLGKYSDKYGTYMAFLTSKKTPKGNTVIYGVEYDYKVYTKIVTLQVMRILVVNITLLVLIWLLISYIHARNTSEKKDILREGMTDTLTGLYNRKALPDIKEMIDSSKATWICIFFDLDGLKVVNDTRGHDAGDKYISDFASILSKIFRKLDIAIRYGGDEFIVFAKISERSNVFSILEKIEKETIEKGISVSKGSYIFSSKDTYDIDDIIKEADEQMYEEKIRKKRANRS